VIPSIWVSLHKETAGSPKFSGYPYDCMPWPQTPVVSRVHRLSVPCTAAFCLCQERRLSFRFPESYPSTTTSKISGLDTQPATSIRPAQDSRYRVCPRTSLLTCWLGFSQVGLSYVLPRDHPLSNIIEFHGLVPIPNDLNLTWRDNTTCKR
jgi:hypothetical protein